MQRISLTLLLLCALASCTSTRTFRKLASDEKKAIQQARRIPGMNKAEAHVLIMTNKGNMVARLFNETPLHRNNFVDKVSAGFYDSLLFHRVIDRFMIQGGDPNSKYATADQRLGGGSAPGDRIPAEIRTTDHIYHQRGMLGAARTNNPEKESSNCQFYIVQRPAWRATELDSTILNRKLTLNDEQKQIYTTIGGTPHLDGDYTVFGALLTGFDVLDSIAAGKTKNERPEEDVRMKLFLLNKPSGRKTK